MLVLNESALDKQYARKMDLVMRHWSGKHQEVVQGINLLTLLWTDGDAPWPCDYRLYSKETDGLSKNDHARAFLAAAKEQGFTPHCVTFDRQRTGISWWMAKTAIIREAVRAYLVQAAYILRSTA